MEAILNGVANLTPEQRTAINGQVATATRAARDEAIEEAKLEFRAGVAGSRKPDQFHTGTTNIITYLETFEPFRAVMMLNGKAAVNAFMTYMDSKAQSNLTDSGATVMEDWALFKAAAIKALSPPQAGVFARFELKKAVQKHDETVAEFGRRLADLGRIGYSNDDQAAKEFALKDALSGGLRRDELAVHLINISDKTFSEMLTEAIKMDGSYQARQAFRENDKYDVTVMKTQAEQQNRRKEETEINQVSHSPQNNPQSPYQGVVCFRCNQPGHFSTHCPNNVCNPQVPNYQGDVQSYRGGIGIPQGRAEAPMHCYYCYGQNHIDRDCKLKIDH